MLDAKKAVIRVIRFLLKLVSEKSFGTLEVHLSAGVPDNAKFVQNWKPQELPQASEADEKRLLGQSLEAVISET